ncbi:MAG: hypothetical protein FJ096_01020 [Deltaproteobacteria bacterium]|nr:hypothetical protein [Deltaproteobacteria bacterium]
MARRLIAASLALAIAGCGGPPPTICKRPLTEEPVPYTQGTVEDGVYMTSDWNGAFLPFQGGSYYEIHHGLGEVPRWWQCYLSFESDGLGSGSVAQAAGNEVELKAIDDETLTVLNGTCVDFWLLCAVGGASAPTP